MDSLTHIVFGAVTGHAIAGKKIGKKAMLWGAVANSLPDIDVVSNFWMTTPSALLAHRGFTHSLCFAILSSLLLSWLFTKFNRNNTMKFMDWMMIFLSGAIFHITIDCMTTYGTGVFEPFSHYRVSFNTIFVADPFFTISLLIATIALLIIKKDSAKKYFWINFGIILSSCYLIYTFINKHEADVVFRKFYRDNNISTKKYFSTPTPLNNWLWMGVAKDKDSIYFTYHSVFDHSQIQNYITTPVNDGLLDSIRTEDDVQKLIRFSEGFYAVENENDTLIFTDARFGQINGWNNHHPKFVFRFSLVPGVDNSKVIQQGRVKASSKKALLSLIRRIKGV